jgi:hypothetical protein
LASAGAADIGRLKFVAVARLLAEDRTGTNFDPPRKNAHLYIQNLQEEIYTCCKFSKESCGKLDAPGVRSRFFHFLAAQGYEPRFRLNHKESIWAESDASLNVVDDAIDREPGSS